MTPEKNLTQLIALHYCLFLSPDDDDDSDNEGRVQNMCSVVWEGVVHDRAFRDWRVKSFPTEPLARDHLKKHKIEHYWDLALSQKIVEEEDS